MVNRFIISIEIGAEFILSYLQLYITQGGIVMAGLCLYECIYFVPMISHLCCGVPEITL
jgi:hypothetical protein